MAQMAQNPTPGGAFPGMMPPGKGQPMMMGPNGQPMGAPQMQMQMVQVPGPNGMPMMVQRPVMVQQPPPPQFGAPQLPQFGSSSQLPGGGTVNAGEPPKPKTPVDAPKLREVLPFAIDRVKLMGEVDRTGYSQWETNQPRVLIDVKNMTKQKVKDFRFPQDCPFQKSLLKMISVPQSFYRHALW